MDDTKKLIEKYKRELMELSKSAPKPENPPKPAQPPKMVEPEEVITLSVNVDGGDVIEPLETEKMRSQTESVGERTKAPQIIGYVSEESGEFPAVFDKFIAEAVENNEIETISSEANSSGEMSKEDTERNFFEPNSESVSNSDETQNVSNTLDVPNEPVSRGAFDPDMEHGTGESISNFPVPEYSTVSEFEASNLGSGTLEFRVSAAREAVPIVGAAVVVTTIINGRNHQIFNATTDMSGETAPQNLPAPSRSLSQDSENNVQPFSLYNATIDKDGFARVILKNIPIFDGVQSIQRVAMVPEGEENESPSEEITEVPNAK